MARLAAPPVEAGFALETAFAHALESTGWRFEQQPVIGSVRPDFLLTGPADETLVVEIKATSRPIHFGTIAQIDRYARLAEEAWDRDVSGALLTTAPVSQAARDAAGKVGVLVISSRDASVIGDSPSAIAAQWIDVLQMQHGLRAPRREPPTGLTDTQRSMLNGAAAYFNWPLSAMHEVEAAATRALRSGVERASLATVEEWGRLFEARFGTRAAGYFPQLTPAQRRVADLIARGMTIEEMTVELSLGEDTIRETIDEIKRALGTEGAARLTSGRHLDK